MMGVSQYSVEGFHEVRRVMENESLSDSQKLNYILHYYHSLADSYRWERARHDETIRKNQELRQKIKFKAENKGKD